MTSHIPTLILTSLLSQSTNQPTRATGSSYRQTPQLEQQLSRSR